MNGQQLGFIDVKEDASMWGAESIGDERWSAYENERLEAGWTGRGGQVV